MQRPLSLYCAENPFTDVNSTAVILPMVEVAFVDFDNNRASIVVETTKWLRVVPYVDGAHITHTIVPVDDRVFRDVQVPRHVLHGDLRNPAEQQSHKFPEWKVTLEERVEPNVPPISAKSTLPSEPIFDISLRDESAGDPATNTLVSVAQQSSASQPLNQKLDVVLEHQAELERTQLLH